MSDPTKGTLILAFLMLESSIKGGRKATRSSVQVALRKTVLKSSETLTGDIAFNRDGDRMKSSVYILQVGNDLLPRVNRVIPVVLK